MQGRGACRRRIVTLVAPDAGTRVMPKEKSRYVIVLGTSIETKGGIAAAIRSYEHAGLFRRWPTVHIPTHVDGTATQKFLVALSAFLKFVRLVISRRVLLVHVHSASNASFWRKSAFIAFSSIAGRPVIFHLHGGGFVEFYDRRCGPVRRWFIRFVLDRVAEIVVLTDEWRHCVGRMTQNRNISVIANPIEARPLLELECAHRRDDVVLFLGRLDRDKGIFDLVDAIPFVQREFPKVKVWLAGEGEGEGLRQYTRRYGLSDAVELLGWVSGDAKRRLLGEATIYVLPSHLEGLPIAVLEAMAAGLPVVASNVGGIPSVIEDGVNGLLVRPRSVGAVAEAICKLLRDPVLRARMGALSRQKIVDRFLPEHVVPRIDHLYKKLAGT